MGFIINAAQTSEVPMASDPYRYQLAIDQARAAESGERTLNAVQNGFESAVPPIAIEVAAAILIAIVAAIALRGRRGYLPEWVRTIFGAKRKLHRRRDLRPKPSPLQPEVWQRFG